MKKFYFWSLLAGFAFGTMAFTGCSSDSSDNPTPTPTPTPEPVVFPGDPANMKFASFSGVVKAYGAPLAGVQVVSGTNVTKTDQNGSYRFDQVNVNGGRVIINFSKAGYMSVTRSIPEGQNTRLDVTLVPVTAEKSFNSESDDYIQIGSYGKQMTIAFGSGYVTENGQTYTGQVTAKAVYLDPDNSEFANEMPGDLSAVRTNNSDAQLISYGMVGVELTGSNGEQLQLGEENSAMLTFPIPDKFKENPPSEIPLWYFDEAKGLWIEEGMAYKYGNSYQGTVTHFSWHNLDSPQAKAKLEVTVKDSKGRLLSYVPVDIAGQRLIYTNDKGYMECEVASEWDFYVRIPSESYGNYAGYDSSKEYKQNVSALQGGSTKKITITLNTSAPIISGAVLNQGAGSNICAVYILYNWGEQTAPVMSDLNGAFQIFAPDYRGEATLVAKFGDGNIVSKDFTITDADQRINLVANNNSSAGKTGYFSVRDDDGLNIQYTLPEPSKGGYWPAEINSGTLMISGSTMPENQEIDWDKIDKIVMFNVDVPNYSDAKTEYTDITFDYFEEGGPHLRLNMTGSGTVVKNGDIYTVKMKDVKPESYEDQMRGMDSWSEKPQSYKVTLEVNGKKK